MEPHLSESSESLSRRPLPTPGTSSLLSSASELLPATPPPDLKETEEAKKKKKSKKHKEQRKEHKHKHKHKSRNKPRARAAAGAESAAVGASDEESVDDGSEAERRKALVTSATSTIDHDDSAAADKTAATITPATTTATSAAVPVHPTTIETSPSYSRLSSRAISTSARAASKSAGLIDAQALFQTSELVASGASGTKVYRALNRATGEVVAVKSIDGAAVRSDAGRAARLTFESEVLELAHDSPYTPAFHGRYVNADGSIWLVMELCALGSVAALMRRVGRALSELQAAAAVYCALQALRFVHGLGVLHLDIKADNLLLAGSFDVKLADFDSAVFVSDVDAAAASAQRVVTTPYWTAPEVLEWHEQRSAPAAASGVGAAVTAAADVWSLGITLIELIDGYAPFFDYLPSAFLAMLRHGTLAPTLAAPDAHSAKLRLFLASALDRDATRRGTVDALLASRFVGGMTAEDAQTALRTIVARRETSSAAAAVERGAALLPAAARVRDQRSSDTLLGLVLNMMENVVVKRRYYHLRPYDACFVACEAVDWLATQLKVTRADAVEVGHLLQSRGYISHVTFGHAFTDSYLFFRFNDKQTVSRTRRRSFSSQSATSLEVPASSSGGAVSVSSSSIRNSAMASSETEEGSGGGSSSCVSFEVFQHFDVDVDGQLGNLDEILAHMTDPRSGIVRKDRKYHFRTYKMVFVGREAVSWMVRRLPSILTRDDAVRFGQRLLERGLWHHVADGHMFEDKYLFYRFFRDEDVLRGGDGSATVPDRATTTTATTTTTTTGGGSVDISPPLSSLSLADAASAADQGSDAADGHVELTSMATPRAAADDDAVRPLRFPSLDDALGGAGSGVSKRRRLFSATELCSGELERRRSSGGDGGGYEKLLSDDDLVVLCAIARGDTESHRALTAFATASARTAACRLLLKCVFGAIVDDADDDAATEAAHNSTLRRVSQSARTLRRDSSAASSSVRADNGGGGSSVGSTPSATARSMSDNDATAMADAAAAAVSRIEAEAAAAAAAERRDADRQLYVVRDARVLDALVAEIVAQRVPLPFMMAAATVELGDEIGRGVSATVYRGTMRYVERTLRRSREDSVSSSDSAIDALARRYTSQLDVAVKVIDVGWLATQADVVRREFTISSLVRHRHLLWSFGCFFDAQRNFCVVSELLRPLSKVLYDASYDISWLERLGWAADTSDALKFLHACSIIHRDLKSDNLLINDEFDVQVADFGCARFLVDDSKRMTKAVGTPTHCAPEMLTSQMGITHAVDTYAFGVVLWELWTRKEPFSDVSVSWKVAESVIAGERPPIPSSTPVEYRRLIESCWTQAPHERPSMARVSAVLHKLLAELTFMESTQ